MTGIRQWFYNANAEPDFKQIVEKSLALFGVFTGATLSFYVKDFLLMDKDVQGFKELPLWSRACVVAAVIALLLRYIVGSASHLNARYVPKVTTTWLEEAIVKDAQNKDVRLSVLRERKTLVSSSLGWLFFDIVMLVAFGVVAVFIIQAPDLEWLMFFASCFVFAGFAWSVIAFFLRKDDAVIAQRWMAIDMTQLLITLLLMYLLWIGWLGTLQTTAILAAVYVSCLLVDFTVMSRPPVTKKKDATGAATQPAA